MNPQTIPWLICGASCILPLLIGVGSFFILSIILDRNPVKETYSWMDEDGRKHSVTEWTMITREVKKFKNHKEEEE